LTDQNASNGGGGRIYFSVQETINYYSLKHNLEHRIHLGGGSSNSYDIDEVLPLLSTRGFNFSLQNMQTNSGTMDITLGDNINTKRYLVLKNDVISKQDSRGTLPTIITQSMIKPDLKII
jgi:hypothetical protein